MHRRDFIRTTVIGTTALAAWPVAAAESDPAYQVGCFTRPWDQWDYRVALDGIAEAGFRYAGIMTSKGKTWVTINVSSTPEEVGAVREECQKRQLSVACIYGGDFPVAESVHAGIQGLKVLIDHARRCACPHLLLGGTTDEKLFAAYYEVVRECCDYAQSQGVKLSIKPHGGQNATGPQCRAIIERVQHRNFGLWYDPGNIYYYSEGKLDPAEDAREVDGLVVGMSIKDFLPPQEVLVTPGTGKVNFPAVLRRLKQGGFVRGPMLIECVAKGNSPAEVTGHAKAARKYLQSLGAMK